MRSSSRRWTYRIVGILLAVVAVQQAWRHGHDHVFPENFAAVEDGKIYRAAWLKSWPLKRVVEQHQIKTIVALAHPPESPMVHAERQAGAELGFEFLHIPIVDDRSHPDNLVLFDQLEKAADAIADPANQPVMFHCHHGVNRASMAQMAYRMLHCGWSLEESQDEIAQTFGLKEVNRGPDYRHMVGFFEDRVLPKRQAQAQAKVDGPLSESADDATDADPAVRR